LEEKSADPFRMVAMACGPPGGAEKKTGRGDEKVLLGKQQTTNRRSCEMSCTGGGGGDSHLLNVRVLRMISGYEYVEGAPCTHQSENDEVIS